LNYGSIDESGSKPKLMYSASGVAASLTAEASGIKAWASGTLASVANESITNIQKYIDWMDQGQFVGQSKKSVFRVQPTQQLLINDCNSYGGGYVKTYTRAELVAKQGPYRNMLDDAATIAAWTPAASNTVYGPVLPVVITPSTPVISSSAGNPAIIKKNEAAEVEPSMPTVESTTETLTGTPAPKAVSWLDLRFWFAA